MERATKEEFFEYFYYEADFGPADSDVRDIIKEQFIRDKGKNLPEGYNLACDGETSLDKE